MPIQLHLKVNVLLFMVIITPLSALPATAITTDYLQVAREQTTYIQSHFYDAKAKKYHDTFPIDPNGLPWTTTWSNGVEWRVLVDAAHDDPSIYLPIVNDYSHGLMDYWDSHPKNCPPGFEAYCAGPGDHNKYYDDNAWMVLGFLDAFDATHDPRYLLWARETQTFVLSGWDDILGGGIYWNLDHKTKNTCVNAPAAVSALRLAELGDPDQEQWGEQILKWENDTLKDENGLYWDNIALDGNIVRTEWTYNAGLMIEADILLYRMHGDLGALRDAERSANAAITVWQDPATGAFDNRASFTHLLCESLLQLYQEDHKIAYLDAVRRNAAFGCRYVRDITNGGFWTDWAVEAHQPDERKVLLENASDARLYWLLAPYPDPDQLYSKGMHQLSLGDATGARDLLEQAADSDTEAVESRYYLWRLLLRQHDTADAAVQQQKLVAMTAHPSLVARLKAVGWTPDAGSAAINQ